MADFEQKVVFKAINEVKGELREIRRDIDSSFKSIQNESKKVESAIQGANNQITSMKNATRILAGVLTSQFVTSIVQASLKVDAMEGALRAATGTTQAAKREMEFVRQESERLGLELATTGSEYAKLAAASRGTTLQGQATRDIFMAVSEASTVLRLSADQTAGALRAIQQIISKGTVSAEELRGQLGERLPGAFQIAARSMGVTTQELGKMLEQGEVIADDFLPRFAREMRNTFSGQVAEAAKSAQSEINRFKNALFDLQNFIAESGFMDVLISGLKGATTAMRFLSGTLDKFSGQQLDIVNSEKLRDALERYKSIKSVLEGMDSSANAVFNAWQRGTSAASGLQKELADARKEIEAIGGKGFGGNLENVDAVIAGLSAHIAKMKEREEVSGDTTKKIVDHDKLLKEEFATTDVDFRDILEARNEAIREKERERAMIQFEIEEMILESQEESRERDLALAQNHLDQLLETEERGLQFIRAANEAHRGEVAQINRKWDDIETKKKKEQQKKEARLNAIRTQNALSTAGNILQAGRTLVEGNRELAILNKIIAIGQIAVNTARAATQVLPNIPLSASIIGLGAAQGARAAAVSFAKGGQFETTGPRMIMVGDNPGGRERVTVEPISSPNIAGPRTTIVNNISYSPTVNASGSDRSAIIDLLSQEREKFADFLIDEIVSRGHLTELGER